MPRARFCNAMTPYVVLPELHEPGRAGHLGGGYVARRTDEVGTKVSGSFS